MTKIAESRARGVAVAGLLALSCSSVYQRKDWSQYEGPGAAYFHAEEMPFPHVDDPLEPVNRVSATVNHGLLLYAVAPLARIYRCIVPEYLRTRLENAGRNLLFPTRLVNNLLQGRLRESAIETSRFAVNTTVGALGLYDPATDLGLHPYPEDFGQTFARWGWKGSTYVFLPFLGPSTVRDGIGEIGNALTDPASYYFPAAQVRTFNALSGHIEDDLRLVEATYDAYEPARTLYTRQREGDVTNFTWASDDSAPTQTLEAIFLAHEDLEFPLRGSTDGVALDSTGETFPYTVWMQPEPAPLVYVIPGLGGHRLGDATLGLAEIAYRYGNSVVTVSSPTNWEFMRYGSTVDVAGYGPVDARDLHVALSAIDARLERRHPGRFLSRRLGGISLGGYQTLLIAAREEEAQREGLLAFDVYVALDTPVDLEHAMVQLDRFYNAPLAFPVEEREERVDEIFNKVLYLSNGELQPNMELPFTQLESQFLIGLAFRLDLQFMILQSQELHDLGILQTERSSLRMAPAFREVSEYSYMEYMYGFVLPYFAERDPEIDFDEAGARRMFANCDLRSVADGLRTNERVRVFCNENDFLLRPQDIDWLRGTLGDRLHLFPAGGHLGNLHRKTIQEVISGIVDEVDSQPDAQP